MAAPGTPAGGGLDPPLAGVRVLELGDTLAAGYCGHLLADLGADVVKVELDGGDPLRSAGPFAGGLPDRDLSVSFAYYHANKQSLCLDPSSPHGQAQLGELARSADVVIRSTRSGKEWLSDAQLDAVERDNPGVVVVDISTFGALAERTGMSDLLALAASGLLSISAASTKDPQSMPLRYRGELASVHAASAGAMAALGGLHARLPDGRGQRFDISAEAAVAAMFGTALAIWSYTGVQPVRNGRRGVAPWAFFECRDGTVLIQVTEDEQWRSLAKILGHPEWAAIEVFETTAQRIEVADAIEPLIAEAIADRGVAEFLAAAHTEGVAAARIQDATDLLAWDHLRARRFFQPITVANGEQRFDVPAPVAPWRLHRTRPSPARRAPLLGEAGDDVGWDARPSAPPSEAATAAPLARLRVIDMTWVWAGPYASMYLAHLGAEVIKIESTTRIDVTRRLGPFADDVVGINRSGYFNQYNQGKKSIVLDVKDERGFALLRRLVASADVIIDNMRAGALARMGLPYDELRRLNPSIVAVSMTGFGEDGPERDRMAYGSIIDALSGVASSNGLIGGGATDFATSLPDPCAGVHTALATVAALLRARISGEGERVELAMLEAGVAAFPWPVLIEGAGAGPVVMMGNRDPLMSPHGVFRCKGDYEWVAIAVETDAQFGALAAAMGRPELGISARFATLADRKLNENELERLVSAWTVPQEAAAVAALLAAAGVPAERVAHIADVFRSPTLAARGFFVHPPHPEVGERDLGGVAWRSSRSPMCASTAAPVLGQHTAAVLQGVAGLTAAEFEELDAAGLFR
jgi:crotonobetainyl-CoA:carnitine CoA-transferase CaiB-like acyl-CoA transferase